MKEYISWKQYEKYILEIHTWVHKKFYDVNRQELKLGAIYGLPRGGLPIAVSLSHKLHLPLLMNYYDRKVVTNKKILVVDDIADTGHTLKDFENPHNIICTLLYHEDSEVLPDYYVNLKGDKWIVYPWERKDSAMIADYEMDSKEEEPWIYETNPDTGDTYRRRRGNYDERELVGDPNQLDLFV